jgi:hypothetical protein
LRLVWRQRCERIRDVDHVSGQIEQVAALAGIIFPLGLLRQLDGAGAIGESAGGWMIDKAGHTAGNQSRGAGDITPKLHPPAVRFEKYLILLALPRGIEPLFSP